MNRKRMVSVAAPIVQLQRQLEEYRRSRSRRAKLPETIWDAAAELAREYGVNAVAQPLRLDYMRLKKRLGEEANGRRDKSGPVFVELVTAPPAAREEYVIEFESPAGSKMRLQWKAAGQPDWTCLLRAWRSAEA